MRIRYDASVDAAHISLVDGEDKLGFGHTYACDLTKSTAKYIWTSIYWAD